MNKAKKGLTIVAGPSQSGKSKWAELLVWDLKNVIYIATSNRNTTDKDWNKRIAKHKLRRPQNWLVKESGMELITDLRSLDKTFPILIDSLGGFVSQYLNELDNQWSQKEIDLVEAIKCREGITICVIEEVGWGVVPPTRIGNIFRDRLGTLAQKLQIISTESWLVIQGRAINLSNISIPIA